MGCVAGRLPIKGFRGFLVMGMPRSGSTWLYHICMDLMEERYPKQFKPPPRVHGYRRAGGMVAFAPYRDPRDSLLSQARVRKDRSGDGNLDIAFANVFKRDVIDKKQYNLVKCFRDPKVTVIRYEDFFPTEMSALICLVAGKMGVRLPEGLKTLLLKKYSLANIKHEQEIDCPKMTQFTITKSGQIGAWREDMTPAMLQTGGDKLDEILLELGYENDDRWKEIVRENSNA